MQNWVSFMGEPPFLFLPAAAGGVVPPDPGGGGGSSEDGSSEWLLISFSGCLGDSVLRHGLLCPRRQSNQNAAGETPVPLFCLIGLCRGRYPVAAECPIVPRNRCGRRPASAVAPRAEGFCRFLLTGAGAVPTAAGSPAREKRCIYLFNRANGRSIDEKPAADRIPEGFGSFSGSAPAPSEGVRLDKRAGVQPEGGWRFLVTFGRPKVTRGVGPGRPRRTPPGAGAGQAPIVSIPGPGAQTQRRRMQERGGGSLLFSCGPGGYSAVSSSFLVTMIFSSSSCFCVPHGMRASRGGP